MASRSQIAGGILGSVLAAAAVAAPVVVKWEGWENTTYPDPAIGATLPTACGGVTKGVKAGQTYADVQCQQMTAAALVEHGLGIAQCLPAGLPTEIRAADTSLSYNLGVKGFCNTRVAKLQRAGDLKASCAAFDLYTHAAGRKLPGLVARRSDERALCEKGLRK